MRPSFCELSSSSRQARLERMPRPERQSFKAQTVRREESVRLCELDSRSAQGCARTAQRSRARLWYHAPSHPTHLNPTIPPHIHPRNDRHEARPDQPCCGHPRCVGGRQTRNNADASPPGFSRSAPGIAPRRTMAASSPSSPSSSNGSAPRVAASCVKRGRRTRRCDVSRVWPASGIAQFSRVSRMRWTRPHTRTSPTRCCCTLYYAADSSSGD